MQTPTVELVLFRTVDGVDEAAFLAASQALEGWLRSAEGFRQRELSHNEEGQWVDIVHWDGLAQALQAAEALMATPEGETFMTFIDLDSIQMIHAQPMVVISAE